MFAFSMGIGRDRSRLGRTDSTPNIVATREKTASTRIGRLAFPSAISPIDIEKTTKLAPIRIDALVSAIHDKLILVVLAATRRLWTSFGKTRSFGFTSFGSLIAHPLQGQSMSLPSARKA